MTSIQPAILSGMLRRTTSIPGWLPRGRRMSRRHVMEMVGKAAFQGCPRGAVFELQKSSSRVTTASRDVAPSTALRGALCDQAIHSFFPLQVGLLRFARNDGAKPITVVLGGSML